MAATPPPAIFAPARRRARRARARGLRARAGAARWLYDDMAEDVVDRLGFLRHAVGRALVIGDLADALAPLLAAQGAEVTRADAAPAPGIVALDEERPYNASGLPGGYDLIAALGTLDTVNDLPGALIHARAALAPGGLLIAAFAGAGSLPALRAAMLAADGARPAARMHPMIDVRAGAQLLQRAGFANPVADSRSIALAYRGLDTLLADLRAQAQGAVLADAAPYPGRAALAGARTAFAATADAAGRIAENVEIVTLSGWRA